MHAVLTRAVALSSAKRPLGAGVLAELVPAQRSPTFVSDSFPRAVALTARSHHGLSS
jgi:hypothetical protein